MRGKYIRRERQKQFFNTFALPIFIILIYIAIRLGIACGNFLFDFDRNLLENIEAENFKTVLNKSLPLLETTYNSGKISSSFAGEIKRAIGFIFNFDLNTPVTVLNANSPIFRDYYRKHYMPYIYQRREPEGKAEDIEPEQERESQIEKAAEEPEEGVNIPEAEGIASSMYLEEETREPTDGEIITIGKIEIINETTNKVDESLIKKLLGEPLKFEFDLEKDKILIYHTHTTESYLKSIEELDKKGVPNWSRDPKYNVVRVGDEITQLLEKKYGFGVLHNGTIHDYPYNSSYSNSLRTVTQYMKSYPSVKILLDIHRDGLATGQSKLRTVQKIDGKNAARIMFVVGTDSNALPHPDWRENLKLAIKIQNKLNEIAPGLVRPIFISKNRYNHHMSKGTLTVEMGGDGNLMSEALESAKYLTRAIAEVIK